MKRDLAEREQARERADRLHIVVHPVRLRLITHLMTGPATVSEASEELAMSVSNVSRHLHILRQGGLVESTVAGRYVIYQLNAAAFEPSNDGLVYGLLRLGPCAVQILRPARSRGDEAGSTPLPGFAGKVWGG